MILSDSIVEEQEHVTISLIPVDNVINIVGDLNFTIFINDSSDNLCTPSLCHPKAVCTEINNGTNTSCDCVPPYMGDGFTNCSLFDPCMTSPCHPNATCTSTKNTTGSGMRTQQSGSHSIMPGFNSGDAMLSGSGSGMDNDETFTCVCNSGLVGDGGTICVPNPCDLSLCDENAVCEWFIEDGAAEHSVGFNCTCNATFVGDGFSCSREFKIEMGGASLKIQHCIGSNPWQTVLSFLKIQCLGAEIQSVCIFLCLGVYLVSSLGGLHICIGRATHRV